jgi:hypothetical protein
MPVMLGRFDIQKPVYMFNYINGIKKKVILFWPYIQKKELVKYQHLLVVKKILHNTEFFF